MYQKHSEDLTINFDELTFVAGNQLALWSIPLVMVFFKGDEVYSHFRLEHQKQKLMVIGDVDKEVKENIAIFT